MKKGAGVWVSYEGGGAKTVERAAALLAVARNQDQSLAPLLVVCSSVVLASALDRATKVGLDFLLQCAPGGQLGLDQPDLNADEIRTCLAERTLENRVRRLPEIISKRALTIHHSNPHGKAIAQLIWYRNRLAHPTDAVTVTDFLDTPQANDDGSLSLSIPPTEILADKWEALTLIDGERFLGAVRIYFDEVINKLAARNDLRVGALLSTATRH